MGDQIIQLNKNVRADDAQYVGLCTHECIRTKCTTHVCTMHVCIRMNVLW